MTVLVPRLQVSARRFVANIFYKYLYLREHRISRIIKHFVPAPQPPGKEIWNLEYNQGYWQRLFDLSEQAHYAVLLSYILHISQAAEILDVGCGEGIILRQLGEGRYRRYVGVDFCESALAKCPGPQDERTVFVVADAEEYSPQHCFDVIVFCESIYYFKDPMESVLRYAKYLKVDGAFAISLHAHVRTKAIRASLKKKLSLLHETTVTNQGGSWFCMLMRPGKGERSPQ